MDAAVVESVRRKFAALRPVLDERARRQWAAAEAIELGRGGISTVAEATGMSRVTITNGIEEVQSRRGSAEEEVDDTHRSSRRRSQTTGRDGSGTYASVGIAGRPGHAWRSHVAVALDVQEHSQAAKELRRQKHSVGPRTVASLLRHAGYSLQANRKTREGKQHPDRNAQFEYINSQVELFQKQRKPTISVDTKKKELVGEFENRGGMATPGTTARVRVHDFTDHERGKAIPYGIYDMTHNEGWVNVGINHDTARFAARSIRRWWQEMGPAFSTKATPDGRRRWRGQQQPQSATVEGRPEELADQIGLKFPVCHFPPGTSKWNKVEHRLFCFITQNWWLAAD